jgi:hypothetical protein
MRQWVVSASVPLMVLLASRPVIMGKVLSIVCRCHCHTSNQKVRVCQTDGRTGAVALIQRFGSALNLNIYFHMLLLDGVYIEGSNGSAWFQWAMALASEKLTRLNHTLSQHIGRFLERQGLQERDIVHSYLTSDAVDENPMDPLLVRSIT